MSSEKFLILFLKILFIKKYVEKSQNDRAV